MNNFILPNIYVCLCLLEYVLTEALLTQSLLKSVKLRLLYTLHEEGYLFNTLSIKMHFDRLDHK